MPGATTKSEETWSRLKPIIECEYVTKNKSATQVAEYLRLHHNFNVTNRVLKSRFSTWGWEKKIPRIIYAAMHRVIQHRGLNISFLVPKQGGTHFDLVDTKKVIKEVKRKESTRRSKKNPPPPTILELGDAYRKLDHADIQIIDHSTTADQRPTPLDWPAHPVEQSRLQLDQSDSDNHSDSGDTGSVASDDSMHESDMATHLNMHNFPPQQQSVSNSLPFAAAYLADLHRNIFPNRPGYSLAIPKGAAAYRDRPSFSMPPDLNLIIEDFADFFCLNANIGLSASQRAQNERFIEEILTEYYRDHDHDGHRKEVLEFSAYYVGQVLAGHDDLDDYNHVDRHEARHKLHNMLERQNMHLLPVCYWVSNMIMSYDKSKLLLGFFEDCIDCIESSSSFLATILRPWIRFVVLSDRDLCNDYTGTSQRLSPAALGQMSRECDVVRDMGESINSLRHVGLQGSHTCLILRIYQAWDLCRGDPVNGQFHMVGCVQNAEELFGTKHLVTITCKAMLARAYERAGESKMAEIYLEDALINLNPCSRMLQLKHCELSLRLTQFLMGPDKLHEARQRLEEIFECRLKQVGAQAPMTWEVAEQLFEMLNEQGFGLEASRRRAEFQARYNEEWQRNPRNHTNPP